MNTLTPIDDARWAAIANRLPDESFRFGVRSTKIYCRSGCPARTPLRNNVTPFATADAARDAGFRPCKRCGPDDAVADAASGRLIERAAQLLAGDDPPSIDGAARA